MTDDLEPRSTIRVKPEDVEDLSVMILNLEAASIHADGNAEGMYWDMAQTLRRILSALTVEPVTPAEAAIWNFLENVRAIATPEEKNDGLG